ncbi:MAG: beta-galactosidase, partial [Candidatus Nanopelagicales bacterium]
IRNSIQHFARGADGIMFFQWRASLAGSEKFHSALVPHAGKESKTWRDVVELGGNLENLTEVVGSTVSNSVAMIWDYESWWALDQPNLPSVDLNYLEQALVIYQSLWKMNIGVDIISKPDSVDVISNYKLVIAPMTYLMSRSTAGAISEFVKSGGNFLTTYFSGISDLNDHVYLGGYPGPLKEVLGVTIEEFAPLQLNQTKLLSNGYQVTRWSERATATTAEEIATYQDKSLNNSVAISRNSFGEGNAWYLGTHLGERDLKELLRNILKVAKVNQIADVNEGVELVRRANSDQSWLFVINHTNDSVTLRTSGFDLIRGQEVTKNLKLAAGEIAVIREKK